MLLFSLSWRSFCIFSSLLMLHWLSSYIIDLNLCAKEPSLLIMLISRIQIVCTFSFAPTWMCILLPSFSYTLNYSLKGRNIGSQKKMCIIWHDIDMPYFIRSDPCPNWYRRNVNNHRNSRFFIYFLINHCNSRILLKHYHSCQIKNHIVNWNHKSWIESNWEL